MCATRMRKARRNVPLTGGTMGWKQPTPTDIHNDSNFNELDKMIFFYAWSMVRRERGLYEFWNGNRFFSVELDRGQCILKVSRIAEELEIDRKKVRKSVEKLQKWYTSVDIERKPYGLILTFKWVDKMLEMDSEMDIERTLSEHSTNIERTTSKKTVKNVENVKNNIILDQKFLEFWENYPRKIGKPKAEKTFKQLKEADIPLVLEGLARYNRYWLEKGTELQYIPHPVTWLNQQRWLDELSSKNVDTHAEYLKKVHAGLV